MSTTRQRRTGLIGGVAVATATVVLAGCGGSTKTVTPTAYWGSVCSATRLVEKGYGDASDYYQPNGPVELDTEYKEGFDRFSAAMSADSAKAEAALRAAGVPRGRDGHEIATAMLAVFTHAHSLFAEAAARAKSDSPTTVGAGADGLNTTELDAVNDVTGAPYANNLALSSFSAYGPLSCG